MATPSGGGQPINATTTTPSSVTTPTPITIRGVLRHRPSNEHPHNGDVASSSSGAGPAAASSSSSSILTPPRSIGNGASILARPIDDAAQLKRLRIIASYSPQAVSLPVLLV
jgi:hypothetical protein